jgi:hypothetical protein
LANDHLVIIWQDPRGDGLRWRGSARAALTVHDASP